MKNFYDGEDLYAPELGYVSGDDHSSAEQFSLLDDAGFFEHEPYFEQGALSEEIANIKTQPTHELFELIKQDGKAHRIRMGTLWHLANNRIIISSKIGDFEAIEIPSEPMTVKKPDSAPFSPPIMSLAALNSLSEVAVH